MKLTKLQLKNFRGYEELEVKFNKNLNVIIGRNDVGKSTILDALNIFFNDEKPEPNDCYKYAFEKVIEISAFFEVKEEDLVILDASNPTSLNDEYLLNEEGLLEIKKVIKASGNTISASNITVHLNTYHPILFENPLITYSLAELKSALEEYKDEIRDYNGINKTKKADIRKAIFNHLISEDTVLDVLPINVKDIQDESMKNWLKLKENLPLFNLFQSDRANTDSDKEVQDPMKAITKEVLSELQSDLDAIRDRVVKRVEEVGEKTIEKLKEFNGEIANQLKTLPDLKNWDTVFKFNLDTDNDIPLNKRGSGVRRLILLSYFRAQAEKSLMDRQHQNIIYAIEEPETSQHPDFQKMIIDSLSIIAEQENSQVFITTHTPEIAQMVDEESLILVSKDEEGCPEIVTDEKVKISEIVNTLGILPTIHSSMVICVEGPNDVNFIKNVNQCVPEFKEIIDIEQTDISIYNLGGSRLIDWINLNHFQHSNIKEFHLYDGDVEKYKELVDDMNAMNDGRRTGMITQLREMENYIPIALIEEEFNCNLSEHRSRWGNFDIPNHLKGIAMSQIRDDKKRDMAIKAKLNGQLTKKVTAEDLKENGVYSEMESWFNTIKDIYYSTAKVGNPRGVQIGKY
ncbi:ATP-binding protein [Guptibacillus hwajinpoensis]|uniref:ATP-dependent OLD family endonuclease n=1 Tax=Guptibacillus hwajinpoensis TaxID=208199 RepID=A0A0J6FW72_9BACL|nr:ATP-binding protein [Alkalihalobacillus macyae]KMM38607.1 ATP-dependent OLD family endonuclease [Alkalihalobacillus macyae]